MALRNCWRISARAKVIKVCKKLRVFFRALLSDPHANLAPLWFKKKAEWVIPKEGIRLIFKSFEEWAASHPQAISDHSKSLNRHWRNCSETSLCSQTDALADKCYAVHEWHNAKAAPQR